MDNEPDRTRHVAPRQNRFLHMLFPLRLYPKLKNKTLDRRPPGPPHASTVAGTFLLIGFGSRINMRSG